MGFFFSTFYQPIANILFYSMELLSTTNLVWGILITLIIFRIIIFPLGLKMKKFQAKMSIVNEKINKLSEIKDTKEKSEKSLKVYKEVGVNPFFPFVFLLVQIPIFLSIFFILKDITRNEFTQETLYSFVFFSIDQIQPIFLSIDLFSNKNIVIALLVLFTQYILMKLTLSKVKPGTKGAQFQKQLAIFLPFVVGIITFFFASALGVYWLINNILSIIQELILGKFYNLNTQSDESSLLTK